MATATISPSKPEDVPAITLYIDYHANEVAADLKYKGKLITINGIVAEIGVNFTGDPYVRPAVDNYGLNSVRLRFSKNMASRLAQLHRGQYVSATCTVRGMVVGDPVLRCPDNS